MFICMSKSYIYYYSFIFLLELLFFNFFLYFYYYTGIVRIFKIKSKIINEYPFSDNDYLKYKHHLVFYN